jgi:hypothetical protein
MPAGAQAALGALLQDKLEVFRACSSPNFLDPTKTGFRDRAYLRRAKDTDGLSVGMTPEDAVRNLNKNHGVGAVYVFAINLLRRQLEVRYDPEEAGHALIHGLPFVEIDRALAEDIGWELARISRVVYCESFTPAD